MNCDQVFDILTRGPFPTGASCDEYVEAHLRTCPECNRLAEALRPALELFQEAVDPEESRDLPGYWCAVATDRAQPAVIRAKEAPPQVAPGGWTKAPIAKHFSAVAVWRLVAALLLGVSVGAVMSMRGTLDAFSPLPPRVVEALANNSSDDHAYPFLTVSDRKQLAALPAACTRHHPGSAPRYSITTPQVLGQADLANLNCCTECHNASSEAISTSATHTVTQSCQICHKD
jgi:hypothetical protein